ncbi:MAG TPA: hypothetical protein VK590_05035 [Saprospiraceae bacterium]|nr:hypothetical protein [Saprospiraceae bacterium]
MENKPLAGGPLALNSGDTPPPESVYKVYTALITQFDEDQPTIVVAENTLGGPVTITRDEIEGFFLITSDGLFDVTPGKTVILPTRLSYSDDNDSAKKWISQGVPSDADSIQFSVKDESDALAGLNANNFPIEIRVYN